MTKSLSLKDIQDYTSAKEVNLPVSRIGRKPEGLSPNQGLCSTLVGDLPGG